MTAEAKAYLTPDEYLRRERGAELRHEYIRGEIYAMSGTSPRHNRVVTNLIFKREGNIRNGPCHVTTHDTKVQVRGGEAYLYPDLVGFCHEPHFTDDGYVLTNPEFVLEVISPSTERHDKIRKFALYKEVPSIREYVIVEQAYATVQQFIRQENGEWTYHAYSSLDELVRFSVFGCEVPMSEIYHRVEFPEEL